MAWGPTLTREWLRTALSNPCMVIGDSKRSLSTPRSAAPQLRKQTEFEFLLYSGSLPTHRSIETTFRGDRFYVPASRATRKSDSPAKVLVSYCHSCVFESLRF